jgi:hypothetical protein
VGGEKASRLHMYLCSLAVPEPFVHLLVLRETLQVPWQREQWVVVSPARVLLAILYDVDGLAQVTPMANMPMHCDVVLPGHITNINVLS